MTSPENLPLPPPVAPKPPMPGECCEHGCDICVWDHYDEAKSRYESAYADWQQRQAKPQ
ncbi:MAG: oxidoreductase-like domain-containing protein [Candidatus Contendobacter sp.]|nr:oxidoreductase-like domain-containing protein [Candidatus Contendobacter sp.]